MIESFRMTAGEIAKLINGSVPEGKRDVVINSVTTDSRETGNSSLFIPLVGDKFNGHKFIKELIDDKRISASLSMEGVPEGAADSEVPVIECRDTLEALGSIGAYCRSRFTGRVYGVTGTNGKTTTKELVHAVLSVKYRTHKSEKNYNNEIGVPFALMGLQENHDAAVFEMGMNHAGEIGRLTSMVRPDIAIITNAGAGHLEFLGSVENVAMAKSEILQGMKRGSLLIVNRDTECFDIIRDEAVSRGIEILSVGMDKPASVYPESYELTEESVSVRYHGIDFSVPFYGKHNIYNLLIAIAVAETEGMNLEAAAEALKNFAGVSGRSEITGNTFRVINDTYNSNPLSSEMALVSVAEIFSNRTKIAVLSDMKELGEQAPRYHYEIGKMAAVLGFDMICLYGEMSESYRSGALEGGIPEENVKVFPDKNKLSEFLINFLKGHEIVLVKGSRSMKMEDVVKSITGGNF